MKKLLFIVFLLLSMQMYAVFAHCAEYESIPVTEFAVSNLSPDIETEFDYTNWQYNQWEDCRYIYLPSTANRNDLTITYTADDTVFLNGIAVTSGESTAVLAAADEFDITSGGKDLGKLKVMQSNLGCIYLHTSTGGLDKLDANEHFVESGSVLMLNDKGGVEYSGDIEKLTSHGNSSWGYSLKKPYNIKLPQKADLYGMGKAKKWMLIANYLDHSMLRNYFTMELSRAAGMEYVIDSIFTDLYADGSYRGTYQLCERIQVQKNRLDIRDLEEDTEKLNDKPLEAYPRVIVGADNINDCKTGCYKYFDIPNDPKDITSGYLLQFQQWNRFHYKAESGFVTARGQVVEIDSPEKASQNQVLYIRDFMQELEDAIYSETGYNSLGKHYSDYIDVDSLAAAYIIDELSMNVDGGATSFYMYKESDTKGDGKLHFAPVWDYDLAYGTFGKYAKNSDGEVGWSKNPNNLYTAYFPINGYEPENTPESGLPTVGVSWLGKMYKKPEFKKIISRVWFDKFEGVLNTELEGENAGIFDVARSIQPSAEMSNARWHTYGGKEYCVFGDKSGKDFMESVDILRDYAQKRKTYLSHVWGPYYERIFIFGDVDGDETVTASDAAAVLQKTLLSTTELPIQTLTGDWMKYADVSCDGIIAADDAACILQKVLREEYIMPAEENDITKQRG